MAAPQAKSIAGLIGVFDMNVAEASKGSVQGGTSAIHENTQESVFDPDYRSLVDPTMYKDGGLYRSIVKLQMRYEHQAPDESGWYMGTGWLITPNIMVTAGHNVYNWAGGNDGQGLGKAVIIHCHIGYHGKESIGKEGVQSRLAKRCVTSAEWLASKDSRNRDFAFIEVDQAFTGDLRLFKYEKTPPTGNELIGVVGYPGDRTMKDSYGRDERGAMMYKEFAPVSYSLIPSKGNPLGMLTYRISTFGGQSGAPVIREGTQVGIATHVYGFGDRNQASPIVDYDNFFNALKQPNLPKVGDVGGVALVKPTGTANGPGTESIFDVISTGVKIGATIFGALTESTLDKTPNGNGQAKPEEESFLDILKSVGSVVSKVGKAVVPGVASVLLGPAGAPVSAIAHAALGALGNACESTLDIDTSNAVARASEGTAERGVMAEAALEAVLRLQETKPTHPVLHKVHADMAESYGKLAPSIKHLVPHLKPALVKSAAMVGLQSDFVAKNQVERTTSVQQMPILSNLPRGESGGEPNAFEEGIMGPTRVVQGEEAFFENVGNFFAKGLQVAKPILRASAVAGLNEIAKKLAASGKQESALDGSSSDPEDAATKLVLQRAVMAESALQAVHKLSGPELQSLTLPASESAYGHAGEEESFFDFVKTAAQKIGSAVKVVAPLVVKHVLPIVANAVAGGGQESFQMTGNLDYPKVGANGAGLAPAPTGPRKQPSRVNLFSAGEAIDHAQHTMPGHVQVSALLSDGGELTEAHQVHEIRKDALQRHDSNEDLPVYHEYD